MSWLGDEFSFDFEIGVGALIVFGSLLGFYLVGPVQFKSYYVKLRLWGVMWMLFFTAILRLGVALFPLAFLLYPIPTCRELAGENANDVPLNAIFGRNDDRVVEWASEQYFLNRGQISVNPNSPLTSMKTFRWSTTKADYGFTYTQTDDAPMIYFESFAWKTGSLQLRDVRSCLGEPTDYLIAQSSASGQLQSFALDFSRGDSFALI